MTREGNFLNRAIPEKCEAVFGQELRKDKELEQMERFKNRDLYSRRTVAKVERLEARFIDGKCDRRQ